MRPVGPPWWLYGLVAVGSAFALPRNPALNPLLETGYLALAVAVVMVGAWRWGLPVGLQLGILAALLSNVLGPTREDGGEGLASGLAQFGVFMLAALAVSSWRRAGAGEQAVGRSPARSEGARAGEHDRGRLPDQVPDAILLADGAGRCVAANRAMAELSGYGPDELREVPAGSLLAPLRPWTADERARFGRDGHWWGELALRRKDGSRVTVAARVMLLDLPSGAVYLTAVSVGETGRAGGEPAP